MCVMAVLLLLLGPECEVKGLLHGVCDGAPWTLHCVTVASPGPPG